MGGTRRGQMAEIGRLGADLVEEFQIDGHARLLGNGQQMQHRVGGAPQRHVAGQGVADGPLVDDLAGGHAAVDQVHDGHAGVFGQLQPFGIDGGNGAVAGQRNADCLAQAIHAVGGVHAGAGTAARAAVAGAILQLRVIDEARLVGAHGLEHLGKADLLAAVTAGQHRPSGAHHGGNVHPHRGHDHAGHDLVAVGHQHQTVQLVGHIHGLHAVTDQFPAGQGILHAHMAHGDAVTDTDGGHEDRGAAGHPHTGLDGIRDFVQVHMPGHDFAVGGHHTDERAVQFLRRVAQRVEQAAVGRPFGALFDVIAVHWSYLPYIRWMHPAGAGRRTFRPAAERQNRVLLTSSASSSSGAVPCPLSR